MRLQLVDNRKVIIKNDRVIIANMDTGDSYKLSKECYKILMNAIEYNMDEKMLWDIFLERQDKEYFQILVEQLYKHRILVKEKQKRNLYITLSLTHRCNLNCIHCCMDASSLNDREYLDTSQWKIIIDKVIMLQPAGIILTGGEAMVRDDFFELVKYLRNHYAGEMELMTNGTLINKRNVKELCDVFTYFSLSLDGADEESCNVIRGKGIYKRVLDSVSLLKKEGAKKISLSMIDAKPTHHLINLFEELNHNMETKALIRVFCDEGRGRRNVDTLTLESKDEYREADKVKELKFRDRPEAFQCSAADKQYQISAQGKLYACGPMEKEGYDLGDVYRIKDFTTYIEQRKYRNTIGYQNLMRLHPCESERCKECDINVYCWSCLHERYISDVKEKTEIRCIIHKKELQSLWQD
jgi:radical SAM protein with 4Fe4S-binding SPASM domain